MTDDREERPRCPARPAPSERNRYFRIRPRRLQAWREANELEGRDLKGDGRWVVD